MPDDESDTTLIQRLRELADKWDPSHYTGEPTGREQCARELRAAIGDEPT